MGLATQKANHLKTKDSPEKIKAKVSELGQFRGPPPSIVTRAIGYFAGGSSIPPDGLQSSQGMPAPRSHASARSLVPRQGRSGWFSHTRLVLSQTKHAVSCKI